MVSPESIKEAKPARRAGGTTKKSAVPVSSPKRPSGSGLGGRKKQEGATLNKISSRKSLRFTQEPPSLIPRRLESALTEENQSGNAGNDSGKNGKREKNGMSIQVRKSLNTEETSDGKRVIHVTVPYTKDIQDMTIELNFENGLQKNTFVVLHMKSP